MWKKIILLGSLLILSACGSDGTRLPNASTGKEVPVKENVEAYMQTFTRQSFADGEYSEEEVTMPDEERKIAYDALQDYRKSISGQTEILNALDIVDEFYINNNTMQHTRKAYGVQTEDEIYQQQYSYLMKDLGLKEKTTMTFQGKKYKSEEWGAKALKVTVNTLQQSAAYEIVFARYDKEAKKVYLHLMVPGVDTYQYFVLATYRDDYEDFFEPLEVFAADEEHTEEELLTAKFVYYTQAVGGEEGASRLIGMGWGSLYDMFLALDVAEDGSIQLTDEMVGALGHVSVSSSNERLAPLFEELKAEE